MKLTEIRVKKFRNFIDSSPIDIEPDITCLVGKNESGKTALLHALYRLLPARSNVKFSIHEQYPAWLEKADRLKGINIDREKPITAKFKLKETDKKILEGRFGFYFLEDDEIELSKDYSGTLYYSIKTDENKFINHLLSQLTIPNYLEKEVRKIKNIKSLFEFIEKIKDRGNVKSEVKDAFLKLKEEINSYINEDDTLAKAVWETIEPYVPKFFYFHNYSTLPYSVEIERILKTPEDQLEDDELTARSLLRLAAADEDYLLNPDYERRKRELEYIANALSQDVLKYWSQNPNLRVLPDITHRTINTPQGRQTVLDELKIRIWDDRHLLSLPFDEHSTGFQWFFSFLAAFSEFEFKETPVIILLDEPALGLHARAQSDFLRFIEERLAPKHQVIYTTHSPFMIQPGKLNRVRIVEDRGRDDGAKVTSDVLTTDPDTLFPLQGALGYDLVQNLFINEHNLIVEGTSDFTYLTVISNFLKENQRTHLNEKWSIVPVGGIDLIPTFVALLGTHLNVTVVIDSQKAGHQKLSRLANKGYLSEKRIITIGEILGRKYADVEDLFSPPDYLKIYNESYSDNIDLNDLIGNDSILSKICRHKNIEKFDHGRPADLFLRKRDEILPKLSEETLSNFEKLFERINNTLEL